MDFAQQTQLLKATEYFNKEMAKIYVRRGCEIKTFNEVAYNPRGGYCYYLSTWAIMGLTSDDQLIRGQIDLPERPRWKPRSNYKHGWVLFSYLGEKYVFDSLESHVWPESYWKDIFNPHKISFCKTQKEILELALSDDNAFQIDNYIWQFKCYQDMKLELNSEADGFLKNTLSSAQIRYSYGCSSYFLAHDHS